MLLTSSMSRNNSKHNQFLQSSLNASLKEEIEQNESAARRSPPLHSSRVERKTSTTLLVLLQIQFVSQNSNLPPQSYYSLSVSSLSLLTSFCLLNIGNSIVRIGKRHNGSHMHCSPYCTLSLLVLLKSPVIISASMPSVTQGRCHHSAHAKHQSRVST